MPTPPRTLSCRLRNCPRWAIPTWPLVLAPALLGGACENPMPSAPWATTAAATAAAPNRPAQTSVPPGPGDEDEDDDPDLRIGTEWGPGLTLVAGRKTPHIVLQRLDDQPPHHGPPTATGEGFVVQADAADGDLPADRRAMAGRAFELITDRGERCLADVEGFAYRVDIVPDSHEWEQWHTPDGEDAKMPAQDRAAAIWNSAYSRWVTARSRLREPERCQGEPLFARPADGTDVRIGKPTAAPSAEQVTAAFRALPRYAEIQRDYERYLQEDGLTEQLPTNWDQGEREPVVQAFALADQRYVSVSMPFAGCSPWDPGLWAVFHWPEGGQPHAVQVSDIHAPERVRLIVRVPGEALDFIVQEHFTDGLTVLRGNRRLATWTSEFHGCGC